MYALVICRKLLTEFRKGVGVGNQENRMKEILVRSVISLYKTANTSQYRGL